MVGAGIAGFLRTAGIGLTTLAGVVAAFVSGTLTGSERGPARVMAWWGKTLIRLGGWTVRVEGADALPREGVILVSNHQSLLDIPLLLAALPGEIKFVAKRELGRIPLFGPAMVRAGNLLVDREDPRASLRLMREAAERLRKGQILVVFPEGTRSADGTVGAFKPGAFLIARRSAAPVFPVYIDGGRLAMPKGSLRVRPAEMVVKVLPPPLSGGDSSASREGMAKEAWRRIASARADENARRAGAGLL